MSLVVKRGNTFRRGLAARAGSVDGVVVRAVVKAAPGGGPALAAFEVTPVAHIDPSDETSSPGWVLQLTASATLGLEPGEYVTDARVETPGGVLSTHTERLTVTDHVTGPTDGA